MSKLLVIVIVLVALAAAALALRLAWSILEELVDGIRDRRHAPDEPVSMADLAASQHALNATMEERRMAAKVAGIEALFATPRIEPGVPRTAWSWPEDGEYLVAQKSVEPVRESFRRMLEGGPNYRG